MTDSEKIEAALGIAVRFGQVDGDHHKAWVIDQMCRALIGPEYYEEFVAHCKCGVDGPDSYEWDIGIEP